MPWADLNERQQKYLQTICGRASQAAHSLQSDSISSE